MRPDCTSLAGTQPLRMKADHEGFGDEHLSRRRAQLHRFLGRQRDRLFAKHVLAGRRGLQRQRHVQVIGQRIVDRLDLGIGEQRLVAAVGRAECPAHRPARGHGPRRATPWRGFPAGRSSSFPAARARGRFWRCSSTPQTTFSMLCLSDGAARAADRFDGPGATRSTRRMRGALPRRCTSPMHCSIGQCIDRCPSSPYPNIPVRPAERIATRSRSRSAQVALPAHQPMRQRPYDNKRALGDAWPR